MAMSIQREDMNAQRHDVNTQYQHIAPGHADPLACIDAAFITIDKTILEVISFIAARSSRKTKSLTLLPHVWLGSRRC